MSQQSTRFFPGSLPGIDVTSGLKRLMGKEDLYRKVLISFFNNNQSIPDEIGEAVKKNDRASAAALTHTIKGTASTLSATDVYDAARNLEVAIREGREDCSRLLAKLDRAIKNGLQAIKTLE